MKELSPGAAEIFQEQGYSIRVVSRLTGLSPDALRIWERRYGFPKPDRTDAGVRHYAQSEVVRLTLIARSIKLGYRVGETICLDESTLRERLAKSSHDRFNDDDPIAAHDLVDCVIGDDPDLLRTRMRRAAASLGTKRFVSELAAPFL